MVLMNPTGWLQTHISPDEAGYYAGYIASAGMLGRVVSSVYWGQMADRIGRKPVLFIGLMSVIFTSVAFGFSVNLAMALFTRFLLGLFNPIIGVAKTLVSEVCTREHEGAGMGAVTGSWGLGLVVGPAIGGLLSKPAERFPSIFGNSLVFRRFPYLLPNLVTAGIGVAATFCLLFLFREPKALQDPSTTADEEHEPIKDCEHGTAVTDKSRPPPKRGATVSELIAIPGVVEIVGAYFSLSIISIMFDEVFPLWAMASLKSGGLHFKSASIGTIMSFTGIALVLYTVLVYPQLAKMWGPLKSYRIGMMALIPLLLITTVVPLLHQSVRWYGLVSCVTAVKMCTNLSFAGNAILINRSVSADKRASVNGLSMTIGSIAKALGPCLGSLIFAVSINYNTPFPFDFHLIFFLLTIATASTMLIKLHSNDYEQLSTVSSLSSMPSTETAAESQSETSSLSGSSGETHSGYAKVQSDDDLSDDGDIELKPLSAS